MKNLITILCLFSVLLSNEKGDVMNKDEAKVVGIGGIFFDNLNNNDWDKDFNFIKDVGLFFKNYAISIINKHKDKEWNSKEKEIQLKKRSRYAEFNLLHDRGTRFGLETGGNIDAILMSMPPLASWD